MPTIKIVNAALDEVCDEIILRGVIAPESLAHLQSAPYQREVLPVTSRISIIKALAENKRLPDVELSMRGQRFKEEEPGIFLLKDDVFIVDGLQRISGARDFMGQHPNGNPHLGACIYFGKDEAWEADRFRILNTLRTKVSPNVLLRNMGNTYKSVEALLSLCTNDYKFVMKGRVSWQQNMKRGELITALVLAKSMGNLHSHKAGARYSKVDQLVPALDRVIDAVGILNFRENTRVFFDLIDECWGIQNVAFREGAAQLKSTFLLVLATLLSDHYDFWEQDGEERKLFVSSPLRKKLSQFQVRDPSVVQLAGSGGQSRELLYTLLRNHVNSGKRTRRLRSRNGDQIDLSVMNGHDEMVIDSTE